ncbi:hypothetical protein [Neobacillus niacini]|uniref:hypothetical protein n=1 Tax=Neobacillus niacini TaxID=86668 RepID=UPI0021CB98E9|nr:hypothetical protein [Neobacillus niacini]MCM3764566.1 hypothetical protein [Neobacillus niacini]
MGLEKFTIALDLLQGFDVNLFVGEEVYKGKLLGVESDHVVLETEDKYIFYYRIDKIQAITKNTKDFKVQKSKAHFQQTQSLIELLNSFQNTWVSILSIHKQRFNGVLAEVDSDFVTLINGEERILLKLDYVSNILKGVIKEEENKEEKSEKAESQSKDVSNKSKSNEKSDSDKKDSKSEKKEESADKKDQHSNNQAAAEKTDNKSAQKDLAAEKREHKSDKQANTHHTEQGKSDKKSKHDNKDDDNKSKNDNKDDDNKSKNDNKDDEKKSKHVNKDDEKHQQVTVLQQSTTTSWSKPIKAETCVPCQEEASSDSNKEKSKSTEKASKGNMDKKGQHESGQKDKPNDEPKMMKVKPLPLPPKEAKGKDKPKQESKDKDKQKQEAKDKEKQKQESNQEKQKEAAKSESPQKEKHSKDMVMEKNNTSYVWKPISHEKKSKRFAGERVAAMNDKKASVATEATKEKVKSQAISNKPTKNKNTRAFLFGGEPPVNDTARAFPFAGFPNKVKKTSGFLNF